MIDLAVIPVAGRGTRLLPLTKSQPKEMLPVAGKPVVQYVVEELIRSGVHRMLFVTGAGKTAIENHFDIDNELIDNLRATGKEDLLAELAFERKDADYFYLRQRRQLGLGHAVLCAEPFVRGQRFVVALGDSIIGRGSESKIVQRMINLFEKNGDVKGVIAFEEVPHDEVFQYGIAQPGKNSTDFFELDDIVEKPSPEEAPSQLAVAARYVFSAEIFEYLRTTTPGKGGEIQLTDAIRRMIHDKKRFLGVHLSPSELRYDIGNFESYFTAFTEFALADPVYGASVKQHLKKLLER
ncbi:MAG: UTP--glucose-1-phosphate uridylyltransferase [Planctomycetaceae bacterium]|jgi:UTP--glucose-1-phosphate uridylyltransferase|nr:UTP--glucose-1-phosphate uridylyltransferase [Planctomycetaceae bacterium]